MNKLTVVIPFLNEGIEIRFTVESIRETAGSEVDIILINDCSQDGFDYKQVANDCGASYFENEKRKGVAASRNIGVSLSTTPYFILIDGHMRFFHNNWWIKVVEQLELDDRALYCLNCKPVKDINTILPTKTYGAYIKFYGGDFDALLEPCWIRGIYGFDEQKEIIEIPCVLGASYAMKKTYWDYLKGLNLLRYYGADEAFLSLKVWREGGRCILIHQINVGHKFREIPPFQILYGDSLYNKLVIAETILSDEYGMFLHAKLKELHGKEYLSALSLIRRNRNEIEEFKQYAQTNFKGDLVRFNALNDPYLKKDSCILDIDRKLEEIAQSLLNAQLGSGNGLLTGNLGVVVFLFEYGRLTKGKASEDIAMKLVEQFVCNTEFKQYNIANGISGVGLAFDYLRDRGFVDVDTEELFMDVSDRFQNYLEECISNKKYGFLNGATGIAYFLSNTKKQKYLLIVHEFIQFINDNITHFLSDKELPRNYSFGHLGVLSFLLHIVKTNILTESIEKVKRAINEIIQSLNCEYNALGANSSNNCEEGIIIFNYLAYEASQLLNDNELRTKSIENLLVASKEQETSIHSITEVGVMQGTAGIAYLYLKLYNSTRHPSFLSASNFWYDETLFRSLDGCHSAGYPDFGLNLYGGISGIGLALLAKRYNLLEWDRLLMLDL